MVVESNHGKVREAVPSDLEAMRRIVDATLFPADLLDGMVRPFFEDPDCQAFWLVFDRDGVLGLVYAEPESMTEGTWNLRAIGTLPKSQRLGVGRALMAATEERLRRAGQRLLIVDTSSSPEQIGACEFYRNLGYEQESRIRDFWTDGEDKITFTKKL
ncbi:MAG: GNAT family N-acetyltransferase [Acidobacteriota bacterium]